MHYEIVIKKTEWQKVPGGKQWERTGQQRTDDSGEVYAYTPEIEVDREVEITVFRQTVEKLDLYRVIRAVNKMQE